ncbi:beta-mannosidase [Cohnella nanjingensis]|uniref:Beta-mannosidase B n=1 Tax=Cohnella nanjingensis TaxID=1387779 RepID=A0A7X0VGC5_9BACL|nr:glycoside hydrolase family 2 protein [Cohnella nanjingensis]MBB6672985.1 glycoside hydrolase family 2 protein [Cohnella nanjingensis]
MNINMDLRDNWQVTGYGPKGEVIGPIAGTVPGHVHTDLLKLEMIPDPMWRDQALDVQWVEDFDWVYETEFVWPENGNRAAAVLRFEGLDTLASVYVNDMLVGSADNMFIEHVFSVSDAIVSGSNRIQVRFTSVKTYLQDKDVNRYVSLFSQDRVYLRKMQCTFGWDWVHRLVSYGIWRPVYLESKPGGSIGNTCLRTIRLNEHNAELAWEVEAAPGPEGCRLQLELADPSGVVVWTNECKCEAESVSGRFTLEKPKLWWPVGYGEACLYRFRTRLVTHQGETVDERCDEIGIRTIEVEEIPDQQGSSFTIVVNGQRIFAKGGNWVPADPFPSRVTREKYDHLLNALVEGNMNMLRVWGGGIYELPAFWEACNRMGIMISLDFMMACAQYPETETWFLAAMEKEVKHAIRELRNHPSLIFWCGDNELAMNNKPEDDYWGKIVSAQVTAPLCAELDPSRPYFPTSPYRGSPFNSQDAGDCHFSTWYDIDFILGDMTDYREQIARGRGRFLSECATAGSPPFSSLLKMMTMEDVADEKGEIWEFRTKDNPYNGQDELTHYRMLEKTAVTLYGESEDPVERVKKLEYVQYEFARLMGEHYRRRKYATSGLLFWMYNDCWPASGWSMIDYYGAPKAGYYGAKNAFAPLMVSIENLGDELGLWMVNDTLQACEGEVAVRAVRTDGTFLFERRFAAHVPAHAAMLVAAVRKQDVGLASGAADVVVEALWRPDAGRQGQGRGAESRTVYFDALPKELRLPKATLQVEVRAADDCSGTIAITADAFARVVTIEEDLLLSDNYFDLLPGEQRIVSYRTRDAAPWTGALKVTCWNRVTEC